VLKKLWTITGRRRVKDKIIGKKGGKERGYKIRKVVGIVERKIKSIKKEKS